MTDLEAFAKLVPLDHGLVVVSTSRANGTIQSSVVNACVLPHPISGKPVVAFVAAGSSKRLVNLRARPRTTVVIRAGWQWTGVEDPWSSPGPTIRSRGSTANDGASSSARSSPQRAERTTTSTSTTGSWLRNAASPSSSNPSASMATADRPFCLDAAANGEDL